MRARMTVLLGTMALAACQVTARGGAVDVDAELPGTRTEEWTGRLEGTPQFAGVRGRLQARSGEGQTRISAQLEGAPAGGTHPWRIYNGRCNERINPSVVGDPNAYTPLRPDAYGNATASAQLSLVLDETNNYHVRVLASPVDTATVVACGSLDD